MSNTITITNRGDSSQSIGETNKLIARIAVLEDRLTKLTDKSSKQADMMGKGYASAEAKVKHFEKALKDASNVRMKFAAIEGLQAASQEFKIAKNDFERSMQMSHAQSTGIDAQIQATKLLRAERDNDWNAVSSQLHAEKSLRDDIIARSNAQYATQQQLNREMAVASQVTANMARDNRANAAALQAFDAKQLRQSMEANGRVHQRDMIGRLSAWQSQSLPSSMAASMSAAATEDKLRRAQADREKQDIVGRLTAYQQQPKPLTMTGAMGMAALEDQKQREQSKIAQRAQAMLDRDAGVAQRRQEIDMRVARARELDAKYALRASDEKSYANSRPGVEIFNSESTIKARRALLLDRKAAIPSDGEDFQKTITELREIDKLLKRINAKPMKAVELGSPKALRQQIKYLEAEMAKIGAGPQWDKLNAKLASAKTQLGGMQQKSRDAEKALSQAATAPMGSWVRLEYELEQAKKELSLLTYGTKEFLAQQAKVAGLQKEWDNVNTAINKTNKSQKAGFDIGGRLLGQATALASSYAGAYQIVAMMTDEWRKQRDFKLQMTAMAATSEEVTVQNLANFGAENAKAIDDWARNNQRAQDNKQGFSASQSGMKQVMGYAMSSGASMEDAKQITLDYMELSGGDEKLALERVLGGMAIARANKSKNYKAAAGQLISAASASQGPDEMQFILNTMEKETVLTNGTSNVKGMSSERGLEYLTTATRLFTDITAEETSGNFAKMFSRMSDFNPRKKATGKDGKKLVVSQADIDAFRKLDTFDARKEFLQAPGREAMLQQFIDSMREGAPRRLADSVMKNDNWNTEMRISEGKIVPFAEGEAVFNAQARAVKENSKVLQDKRKISAGNEFGKTTPSEMPYARAVTAWTGVFEGDESVNLTGPDWARRAASYGRRTALSTELYRSGSPPEQAEVRSMIADLNVIKRTEQMFGNQSAVSSIDTKLSVLNDILEEMRKLNASVESAKNRPADRLTSVDPKLRVPPVPRVPIAIGKGTNDPFGMRKR